MSRGRSRASTPKQDIDIDTTHPEPPSVIPTPTDEVVDVTLEQIRGLQRENTSLSEEITNLQNVVTGLEIRRKQNHSQIDSLRGVISRLVGGSLNSLEQETRQGPVPTGTLKSCPSCGFSVFCR